MEQEQDDEYVDKSSEVGRLIVRANQLEKRPILDNSLGEVLDSFLRALMRSEDFLINGIFKINFAEAAILLQSCAFIYCKKVDLLWDSINECQKRLISYKKEDNREEIERIEERERKYKRIRKHKEKPNKTPDVIKLKTFNVDWDEVDNFQNSHFEKDSKLYSGWHKKMIMNWDLQPTPKHNRSLADKQIQFRSPENAIFDGDHDNEFVAYTSKMESAIGIDELFSTEKLIPSGFSFQLYTELYLVPKFLRENHFTYEDLEKHTVEVEKYIESYKDLHFNQGKRYDNNYDKTIDRQTPQKLRRVSITSTIVSRVDMSDLDNLYIKQCQVKLLRLSVDDLSRMSRLSVDEVKKISSCYERDHSKLANFQDHFSSENKVEIETNDSSPQNTGGKDVDINISSLGALLDTLDCDLNIDKGVESSTLDNAADSFYAEITNKPMSSPLRRSARLNSTKEIAEKAKNTETRKTKIIEESIDDDDEEIPQKRRKLSKAAMKRLASGITVDLEKFNSFMELHYRPEEGEGSVEIPEFTLDDPIDSSSTIDIHEKRRPSSLISDRPMLCTQDSGYESHFQETIPANDTSVGDITSNSIENDDQVPEQPLEHITPSEPCVEDGEKPLYQRVYEWKEHMSEKFKQMKSADFDIHEYGSNIMESFEEDRPRKFSNIVKGKSAAEVTRFFISALQLANTYNVEIQGAQNGKLSNETFELKLISKERYYDRLKDYMAPSEQDYNERLSSAQKMHKKRSLPSTSGVSCSSKRNKYQ